LKSLAVLFAALFLIVGCVTVGPGPSLTPGSVTTAAPSLGVTTPAPPTSSPTLAPTPTAAPTPTPTLPPTATPTLTGTPVASLPASIGPSTGPSQGPSSSFEPSTRDQLFADDFSDPSSGWQLLDQDFATISYDSGALALRFNSNEAWAYSVRALDGPHGTVVQAADFAPQSDGIFGLLCGDTTSQTYYGAVVATDGGLVFIESDNGTVNVLKRFDDLALDVTVGSSNLMALECAIDGNGALDMVAGLSGTGPVGVRSESTGLSAFDTTGVYGEAMSDGYTLAVDTAAAWASGGTDGTMSDDADILYQHIPTALQEGCYESPNWNTDADTVVTCVEQLQGKGAEILQLQQFSNGAGMEAGYQRLVDAFGVVSEGSCESGPNEAPWTVNEQEGGRVQCAPQFVGIRFDWTDELTSILSSLIDFEGSYKDTYDVWVDAGPIIPQG
jgi:hypothetical protein